MRSWCSTHRSPIRYTATCRLETSAPPEAASALSDADLRLRQIASAGGASCPTRRTHAMAPRSTSRTTAAKRLRCIPWWDLGHGRACAWLADRSGRTASSATSMWITAGWGGVTNHTRRLPMRCPSALVRRGGTGPVGHQAGVLHRGVMGRKIGLRDRRTRAGAGSVAGDRRPTALRHESRRTVVRAVTDGVVASRTRGIEALIEAFERIHGAPFPDEQRQRYLEHDPAAIDAAWNATLAEGTIVKDLLAWRVRCLIYTAIADVDFLPSAPSGHRDPRRRVPLARGLDHLGAHFQSGPVLPAVLRLLHASD